MGGAPITFTLYRNGIHIISARPSFITCAALEREMARAFDAGEEVEQSLWDGPLSVMGGLIVPAVDNLFAADKRGESYPEPPVEMTLRDGELHPLT